MTSKISAWRWPLTVGVLAGGVFYLMSTHVGSIEERRAHPLPRCTQELKKAYWDVYSRARARKGQREARNSAESAVREWVREHGMPKCAEKAEVTR